MRNFEKWKNKKLEYFNAKPELIRGLIDRLNSYEDVIYNAPTISLRGESDLRESLGIKARKLLLYFINVIFTGHNWELDWSNKKLFFHNNLKLIESKLIFEKSLIDLLFKIKEFANQLSHPEIQGYEKIGKLQFAKFLENTHTVFTRLFDLDYKFDITIYKRDEEISKQITLTLQDDDEQLKSNNLQFGNFDLDELINTSIEDLLPPERNKETSDIFNKALSNDVEYEGSNYDGTYRDNEILSDDIIMSSEEKVDQDKKQISISLDGIDLDLPSESENIEEFIKQWKK